MALVFLTLFLSVFYVFAEKELQPDVESMRLSELALELGMKSGPQLGVHRCPKTHLCCLTSQHCCSNNYGCCFNNPGDRPSPALPCGKLPRN